MNDRLINFTTPCHVLYPTPGGLHADLLAGGWPLWIERNIMPTLQWLESANLPGRRRIMLHNPFAVIDQTYRWEQFEWAKSHHLPTAKDFAKAWAPLAGRIEIIAYLGQLSDKTMTGMKKPGKFDDYARRFVENVRPLMDANCSIGFDSTSSYEIGSAEYEGLDWLRSMVRAYGGECYIEPRPYATCPHLWDWGVIGENEFWKLSDPSLYPAGSWGADHGSNWGAPTASITGEIVRIVQTPPGGMGGSIEQMAGKYTEAFNAIVADGHTACLPADWLAQAQCDPAKFIARATEPLPGTRAENNAESSEK